MLFCLLLFRTKPRSPYPYLPSPDMVAITGVLKARVLRGENLAVRDMFSSDPYVKLNIGEQAVKTRTIMANLNPHWDEELTLGVSDGPNGPLPMKVSVYDKDVLTKDDKMGDVKIDLQPLVTAAKHYQSNKHYEDGKELMRLEATAYNNFVRDSIIRVRNGNVKQEILVKLDNVERGEIELELEWLPISTSVHHHQHAH